jgi:hypothetical protein
MAADAGVVVSFEVEAEDKEVIAEAPQLSGGGVAFAVYSGEDETDVVRLWNSAMNAGHDAIRLLFGEDSVPNCSSPIEDIALSDAVRQVLEQTSLGKFATSVIRADSILAGGLAFFDGGIRSIVEESPGRCLRNILSAFLLPWDCGPDALYVWCAPQER